MNWVEEAFLKQNFPTFFSEDFCFRCDNGWSNLIDELCAVIEEYFTKHSRSRYKKGFIVDCVKQKFGGLRFYTSNTPRELNKIIWWYCTESFHICELCGKSPAKTVGKQYVVTLCRKCANADNLRWL